MQVEKRVRELGQKSYWEQFEHSPEFAVLFLPGDQFLSAALAERPDLIDSALKQRIIVTTPSTLMALLKVIAYGWRQNLVTENAREIRKLGAGPAQAPHDIRRTPAEGVALTGQRGRLVQFRRWDRWSATCCRSRASSPNWASTSEALPSVDPIEKLVRCP